MTKRLSEILPRLYEEGEGYPPPDDPKILPGKPDGQKRFVLKHTQPEGKPKPTDIDPSTTDDKLFKATNITRAVPKDGDTHGHTPVGKDAAVYEAVIKRVLKKSAYTTGEEQSKDAAKKNKVSV